MYTIRDEMGNNMKFEAKPQGLCWGAGSTVCVKYVNNRPNNNNWAFNIASKNASKLQTASIIAARNF